MSGPQTKNGVSSHRERPSTPTSVSLYQPIAHLFELEAGGRHSLSRNTNLRRRLSTFYVLILFLSVNRLKPHMRRPSPIASTPDRKSPRRRYQRLNTEHLCFLPTHSLCKAASRMYLTGTFAYIIKLWALQTADTRRYFTQQVQTHQKRPNVLPA